MKKILLMLMALMLIAGTAYAGGGYGGWYDGPVVIPGNPFQPVNPRNESYIVQKGHLSWAMVLQSGDQSKSMIYQDTHFGTDKAVVVQHSRCCSFGWFPLFTDKAHQNISKIKQTGSGWHDAYVNQNGDGNKSKIRQSSTVAKADVRQKGGFNESVIDQYGCGINQAYVRQMGDLNKSYILQGSGLNTARVNQHGFGNVSAVFQDGFLANNTALVNQGGYMNLSKVYQGGNGTHTAIVNQLNNCFNATVAYCSGGGCF